MVKVEIAKCPNCGGELINTKTRTIDGKKEFYCWNCKIALGYVKD